jgi:membrane protein implicated in regulation of membrane protease activity
MVTFLSLLVIALIIGGSGAIALMLFGEGWLSATFAFILSMVAIIWIEKNWKKSDGR